LEPADLQKIPQGVIGGLIVERAEQARARTYSEPWGRELALWNSITEGLAAAAAGERTECRVDRLPSWLLSVVRARLRDHGMYWSNSDFVVARLLELVELANFEPDDDYVMSMLTGLTSNCSLHENCWNDPVTWFRWDPDLIDRGYWRAYEIEGQGVVSLRVQDGGPSPVDWRKATQQMIKEGMITRDQVITACFGALDRDFSPAASQWFVRLLTDLELTDDELAELQPFVRRHLNHRAPVVVKNALSWMERLDRHGLLDHESAAPALEAAVVASTKVTAMAGLRLLERIRVATPTADVVTAARAGLGHPHTDVQRAAARLMVAAGAASELSADADVLDPSIQREFGLQSKPGMPPADMITVDGVQAAAQAQPLPLRAVTQHDLAERLAALLEHAQDPLELELVLDQLARTGPTDLLQPLAKRAHTVVTANESGRLEQQLAALVLAACGTPVNSAGPAVPWARFLLHRLQDVERILTGSARPTGLLAAPTDRSGWVDPVTFVDRALAADPNFRADVIAGLLRLAPDGRQEALRKWRSAAAAVDPQLDQVVRHALGEERHAEQVIADRPLWVAASRARSALQDDAVLIENGLDGAGQGRALAATVSLAAAQRRKTFWNEDEDPWELHVTYDHACTAANFSKSQRDSWWTGSRPWDVDQPTAVGDRTSRNSEWVRESWAAWNGLIWPADAEHYAAMAIIPTYRSRNWSTPSLWPAAILAGLRRHPGRMGPIAAATLALAAVGWTAGARIHAADTIVDLIGRQRMTIDELAAAFVAVAPAVIPMRWANTLTHVSAAGRVDITVDLLARLLPALPRDRHGLHALLDLLHQELLRTNATAPDERLRSYLTSITGSSKAARSARAILNLS
jgi:hypothetical protein